MNTFTTSEQRTASVASNAAGDFVIVWQSQGEDGAAWGIFGRRYDRAGAPLGTAFPVNTFTTSYQDWPSVASDAAGRLVAAWHSEQDGSNTGIFARRFDVSGAARGTEFQVNTYTPGYQVLPDVAAAPSGSFVVVWQSQFPGGSVNEVVGRRYDAAGAPIGLDFQVNTYTSLSQDNAAVASDAEGNFLVAWESDNQDGSGLGVFARLFNASGVPLGPEFRVNTYTIGDQSEPDVASTPLGIFVVAWQSRGQDGSNWGIFGRRYHRTGNPLGPEFPVNTFTTSYQDGATVACAATANCTFAWHSHQQDGSNAGIFAQRFDSEGNRRGPEFQVNTQAADYQDWPAVASDMAGNFVVAWESTNQDGSGDGVFAQRFGGLLPAALAADPTPTAASDGNGVLEPGESSVDVKPSWRNVNGAMQVVGGDAIEFWGPAAAGIAYVLIDATGYYSVIPDGATIQCFDCYKVGVGFGGTRPAVHWDAWLVERLTPDYQGQVMPWTVHVGESFTDVPKTSPFYRFVETLLHKGVTGGCGATTYCPANTVTREQMAPFVLVAREGSGYGPPACTTPIFGDVPASSPFCRWIEELARRGVVSGCGGGNYCPTSSVTREQMPIFVLRTLDATLNPPACTTPMFGDVPASSPFCRWIEELARRGVVTGCGGGNYCPLASVTRDQMGVFISATFGLALYGT